MTEPQTISELISLAKKECKKKNWKTAIIYLNKAIEIEPNTANYYCLRGVAKIYKENIFHPFGNFKTGSDWDDAFKNYKNSSDYQDALEDLAKAIELEPNNAKWYSWRGYIRGYLSDSQEAVDDYTKAIEIDPNNADFYLKRGWRKRDLGDYQGAIDDYSKAIEIDPNYCVYDDRARAKTELGDYQGAIDDLSISIEMDPKNISAYLCRAEIKRELKDYKGAVEDLTKVKEIRPNAYDRISIGHYKSIIRNGADSKLIKKVMQKAL